jgi:hypothetical protein
MHRYQCHADFPYIMKFRCQFVAALKDAELLCTAISGTAIGIANEVVPL